jgi:glycosyltransferase involved in cell wall biosynthesis
MSGLGRGTVSGCVIARNEEAVIDRCLTSLDGVVDELVFVHDGPCADRTLEIARAHGARVFEREGTGNPEAHTVFAYEEARGEWLLNIDADEFLSDELRAALPELVRTDSVNGYLFLWRLWDGERYVTQDAPHKLALHRRSATRLLGMLQSREHIEGTVQKLDLQLEHRPLYNNWTFRTMTTKWRRWARVHARELTGPFADLPKFNWDGPWDWPWYRRWLNRLSPVLFVPYLGTILVHFLVINRRGLTARENLRISLLNTAYAGLVQAYVVREMYGARRPRRHAPDPARDRAAR